MRLIPSRWSRVLADALAPAPPHSLQKSTEPCVISTAPNWRERGVLPRRSERAIVLRDQQVDLAGQRVIGGVRRTQVDRDAQVEPWVAPLEHVTERDLRHPQRELLHQPGQLGVRRGHARIDEPAGTVLPARKHLDPDDNAGPQVQLGLKHDDELILAQCSALLIDHPRAVVSLAGLLLDVDGVPEPAALGLVHCQVRLA